METQTQAIAAKHNHIEELGELLTVAELAVFLKVQKSWVYGRLHSKTLPFPYIKLGHYPRFPVAGVREYLAAQTQPGHAA